MAYTTEYYEAHIAELKEALEQERAHSEGLAHDCEEMCLRLERLSKHLRGGIVAEVMRKLADYAEGAGSEYRDTPPEDPFPDPPEPKRARRRK